jgi:hypothetical protein
MNRFLLLWSLISPTCSCLIVGWAFKRQSAWDFTGQFDMYLAYWIVLALGQSLLLWWVYRQRSLAVQWFITTALAGTAIMQSHDLLLALTGIDPRGQGMLILMLSIPLLALFGGFFLGLAQWYVLQGHTGRSLRSQIRLSAAWAIASFLSWTIGFCGILLGYGFDRLPGIGIFLGVFLCTMLGTLIKGFVLMKYLKQPM